MPERREDDLVGSDGEPVSAAHAAIYLHISECRDEMIEELHRMDEEHLRTHHHPPVSDIAKQMGRTPTQLMTDFIDVVVVSRRVVDALEGPEVLKIDGSTYRKSGEGIIHKVNSIEKNMSNGVRHKLEITKLQYGMVGTFLTVLGTIAVALLK